MYVQVRVLRAITGHALRDQGRSKHVREEFQTARRKARNEHVSRMDETDENCEKTLQTIEELEGQKAGPPYYKNETEKIIANGETSLLVFETKKKKYKI